MSKTVCKKPCKTLLVNATKTENVFVLSLEYAYNIVMSVQNPLLNVPSPFLCHHIILCRRRRPIHNLGRKVGKEENRTDLQQSKAELHSCRCEIHVLLRHFHQHI